VYSFIHPCYVTSYCGLCRIQLQAVTTVHIWRLIHRLRRGSGCGYMWDVFTWTSVGCDIVYCGVCCQVQLQALTAVYAWCLWLGHISCLVQIRRLILWSGCGRTRDVLTSTSVGCRCMTVTFRRRVTTRRHRTTASVGEDTVATAYIPATARQYNTLYTMLRTPPLYRCASVSLSVCMCSCYHHCLHGSCCGSPLYQCLSVCLCISMSVCLSVSLSVSMSVCQYV